MKVYIVMSGEDCEGGFISAIFENEADAIKRLEEEFEDYCKVSPRERRLGCHSAYIEEWDVE